MSDNKKPTMADLLEANRQYTNCLSEKFVPRFLNGEAVSLDQVCAGEREQMLKLDRIIYPNDKFNK